MRSLEHFIHIVKRQCSLTIFWALNNNNYINKEAASHKDSCTFWEEMCSTITFNTGYPTPKLTIIAILIGQKSNFLVTTKEGGFTQVCSKAKDVTKICKISQCALYKQPSFIGGFGGGDGLVNHNVSF